MLNKIISKIIGFILLIISLVNCGGGGSGSPNTPVPPPVQIKAITTFALNGVSGVIQGNSITVVMPYGTDLTNLVATFNIIGETVTVNGVIQLDGQTANDFTKLVIYTVYAADGSSQDYGVIVSVASRSDKDITEFSLNGVPGVISNESIEVIMPYGTNVTNLVATYLTDGESITVNNVLQTNGVTPNNFTGPVIYTVHAADNSTKNYTVTVKVASNSAKDITVFDVPLPYKSYFGVIQGTNINITVPGGTDITTLRPRFIITGEYVIAKGVVQISGNMIQDFTQPVIYTVYAADGTTKDYTVTVIVESDKKDMLFFTLDGKYQGSIGEPFIFVYVPYTVNLSNLIATFGTNGVKVTVNGIEQVSGITRNSFINPVTYVVYAADGSTREYTVIASSLP